MQLQAIQNKNKLPALSCQLPPLPSDAVCQCWTLDQSAKKKHLSLTGFSFLYFPGASTLGQALKASKYSESSLQRYVTCALTGEQTFLFNECSSCSSVIKSFVSYRTFLIFLKRKKLRLENTLRYQVTWFLVKILKLAWICYNYCIKINLIKLFWKQLTWSSLWQRLFSYLCLLCSVLLGLDVS